MKKLTLKFTTAGTNRINFEVVEKKGINAFSFHGNSNNKTRSIYAGTRTAISRYAMTLGNSGTDYLKFQTTLMRWVKVLQQMGAANPDIDLIVIVDGRTVIGGKRRATKLTTGQKVMVAGGLTLLGYIAYKNRDKIKAAAEDLKDKVQGVFNK